VVKLFQEGKLNKNKNLEKLETILRKKGKFQQRNITNDFTFDMTRIKKLTNQK
jgi:hypothetical protein